MQQKQSNEDHRHARWQEVFEKRIDRIHFMNGNDIAFRASVTRFDAPRKGTTRNPKVKYRKQQRLTPNATKWAPALSREGTLDLGGVRGPLVRHRGGSYSFRAPKLRLLVVLQPHGCRAPDWDEVENIHG